MYVVNLTFIRCLLTHFVKVFFWTLSRSSVEIKQKLSLIKCVHALVLFTLFTTNHIYITFTVIVFQNIPVYQCLSFQLEAHWQPLRFTKSPPQWGQEPWVNDPCFRQQLAVNIISTVHPKTVLKFNFSETSLWKKLLFPYLIKVWESPTVYCKWQKANRNFKRCFRWHRKGLHSLLL